MNALEEWRGTTLNIPLGEDSFIKAFISQRGLSQARTLLSSEANMKGGRAEAEAFASWKPPRTFSHRARYILREKEQGWIFWRELYVNLFKSQAFCCTPCQQESDVMANHLRWLTILDGWIWAAWQEVNHCLNDYIFTTREASIGF